MKRSEMIIRIRECLEKYQGVTLTTHADLILEAMEHSGMLPPIYPNPLEVYHGWEPEED